MIRVLASASATSPAFADGFGRRVRAIDPDVGDEVELFELAPALVEHDGFVTALGERVARVSSVRHASYVHLRRLDRPAADRLSLVSDYTPGWRLSELLRVGAETNTPVETTVVIGLLRQLLPALSLFSRHNRESAIGALAPERLIVTPQARLVIPEHAFGPALEKLNLGRDRCWREFRIAMPPSAGLPRANARADANALGVIALSLLLGRLIDESEYPNAMPGLIESATERRNGETVPLSAPFAQWITRALQFDVRSAFQTPHEAQVAFEAVLASDRGYVTTSGALEKWVTEIGGAIDIANAPPPEPPPPPPPPEPPPPVVIIAPAPIDSASQPAGVAQGRPAPAIVPIVPAPVPVPIVEPEPEEPVDSASQQAGVAQGRPEEPPVPEASVPEDPAPLAPAAPEAPEAPYAPQAPYAPEAPEGLEAQVAPSIVRDSPFKSPLVLALLVVVVLMSAAVAWLWLRPSPGALAAGEGELVVQSRPPGKISIDGKERGVTPQTIRLPAGAHVLEVQIGTTEPRVIPLTIRAGVQTSQYVELQNVPMAGGLDVRSEPAGARVTVDGKPYGTTPATLKDLPPGDHEVVLELGGRKVRQVVRIDAGITAQLVVPMARK